MGQQNEQSLDVNFAGRGGGGQAGEAMEQQTSEKMFNEKLRGKPYGLHRKRLTPTLFGIQNNTNQSSRKI
jgi:hypothetical protein